MKFVIFDTEFTTWEGALENNWSAPGQTREVVQIAALKINEKNLKVDEEFNILIRPTINHQLSEYFEKLTGITNEKVAREGVHFVIGYEKFKEFVDGLPCYSFAYGGSKFADGDVMNQNLMYNNMHEEHPIDYRNIAEWFAENPRSKDIRSSGKIAKTLGVDKPLARLGLDEHNALYDVYSILEGLRYLNFNA